MDEPEAHPGEDHYENMPFEEIQDIHQEVMSMVRKGKEEDKIRILKLRKQRDAKFATWRRELTDLETQARGM